MSRTNPRGFTLLEVLVALLIFSLGLIGIAGLLTVSVVTNHSAYLRTQAIFLAQGMADRMHANPLGLWNNSYQLHSITTPPTAPTAAAALPSTPQDCSAASCTYAEVATRDLQQWQNQLRTFLPTAGVAINCTVPATVPSNLQLLTLPPYSTTCEIEVSWTQMPIQDQTAAQAAVPEIFDWVFQP
jgi:type IV pilus assembly protein PilV